MSKMTDKEIKKALEICSITNMVLECKDCPYDTFNARNCTTKLCEDAIDLINRQQAEIERLQRLLEQEEKSKNSLTKKCYKDGITEFAEKLKADINKTWYYELENDTHNARALERVDELVKEMVGDDK
jgi:hypothetical protein